MHRIASLLVAGLFLAFGAAAAAADIKETQELLIGKWDTVDDSEVLRKSTVEFTRDGMWMLTVDGKVLFKAKYRVIDEKTLELEYPSPKDLTRTDMSRAKIVVSRKELTIMAKDGEATRVTKYKRAN